MTELRRLIVIGTCIVGSAGVLAPRAHAELAVYVGDAFCHAESTGPHYYHSRAVEVFIPDRWLSNQDWIQRRWERQTLQYMAAEFARYVAEHHEVEYLLSAGCELTEPESVTEEMEAAAYVRDGMVVPYAASERTVVDWLPNFSDVFRWHTMSLSRRVALVIGNGAYAAAPGLRAAANDAEDVGAALERLGFSTTVLMDAEADDMWSALWEFGTRAASADMAVVFYSGYGLQAEGSNYLLALDASTEEVGGRGHLALGEVVGRVQRARSGMAIVDAGLPAVDLDLGRAPDPYVVVALTGTTTEDSGRNGVYTTALLTHLEEPGVDSDELFRRVGATLSANTAGRQRQTVYSTAGWLGGLDFAGSTPQPPPSGGCAGTDPGCRR